MQISKIFHFEASHLVPESNGLCKGLHGHSWKVEFAVMGDPLTKSGSVFKDQNYLKHLAAPIIQRLNGQHLNFIIKLPTIENVCLYIAHELRSRCELTLAYCHVEVPSMFSAQYTTQCHDEDLLDDEGAKGFDDAFHAITAFASMEARARWVHKHKLQLSHLYSQMTVIGSELAAFEQYKASLDEQEAARLLELIEEEELPAK